MMMEIQKLLGLTLETITVSEDNSRVEFFSKCGRRFEMYHSQDCCESVTLDDVGGDLMDLCFSPITQAEESTTKDETPDGVMAPQYAESFTWTFYRLATARGQIVMRWFGSSNGYYSEDVSFAEMT